VRLIERVWSGDSAADKAIRAALSPLELLYRAGVALRGSFYDTGLTRVQPSPIPTISIGNLTVGGTGKTPVAAWVARRLKSLGETPAIVLRGYGGDEPLVHSRINPDIPVIVSPDRAAGIAEAKSKGATVAVLDDAFQHRRAARDVDVVLISADNWQEQQHVLPAGPYREPMSALSRASAVIITRKAADDARVQSIKSAVKSRFAGLPIAVASLSPGEIVLAKSTDARAPIAQLAGKRVCAIAAVGNPGAFFEQLERVGAQVTRQAYPDHHPFSKGDVAALAAASRSVDYVVCTLKDAVKLEPSWPADGRPLWYVSLAVAIESGKPAIEELLARLSRRKKAV
jgi:tetraacyldisaccharide 4'-kinase